MSFRTKALTGTAAASIAIATATIASWEGLETKPYFDVAGIQTVCYGETNVPMKEYTEEQCRTMLANRVPEYYEAAMKNVEVDIPITMAAAVTSFTYNVGPDAFKKSTMLKKINKKDLWGACDELDRWVYAARMWVRGLANRREAEKRLCVAELPARGV